MVRENPYIGWSICDLEHGSRLTTRVYVYYFDHCIINNKLYNSDAYYAPCNGNDYVDTDPSERPQWLRLMGRLKSASMSCLSEAGGRLLSPSSPISPQVPMSPQIEMANSVTGMETALFSLLSSSDAFYDRTPWFNPIGRGQHPLSHLLQSLTDDTSCTFQHRVRIINNTGELKGAITVRTEALPLDMVSNVGCIILLGDEGKHRFYLIIPTITSSYK